MCLIFKKGMMKLLNLLLVGLKMNTRCVAYIIELENAEWQTGFKIKERPLGQINVKSGLLEKERDVG